MTSPDPRTSHSPHTYGLASIPALLLGFGLAFVLRPTELSPGARTGIAFFTFVLAQTFLRRALGERAPRGGWLSVVVIGFATSVVLSFIADL